jgi:hypothetical protein
MKKHEIETQMLELSMNRDVAGLTKLVADLNQQIRKMDAWFDMFLDKFDRKMDTSETNTPIWQMYNKKFTEYEELKQSIKRVSYFREKYANI